MLVSWHAPIMGLHDSRILALPHEKPRHFGGVRSRGTVGVPGDVMMQGMAEQPSRRRRIRRATITVALPALMVAWYVASYLSLQWLRERGAMPKQLRAVATAVCRPLDMYCETDWPAAEWLDDQRVMWMNRGFRAR